ncbi:MAG TPA: hypothetical protein VJ654_20815 [Noviherbaspirillum sp.]|nr:hypothetical protein [Noviherbaspirillum sp.]
MFGKKLVMALVIANTLGGCATRSNDVSLEPEVSYTVTLREPFYFKGSTGMSWDPAEYGRITSVTGIKRGVINTNNGELWARGVKKTGIFSYKTDWMPIKAIAEFEHVRTRESTDVPGYLATRIRPLDDDSKHAYPDIHDSMGLIVCEPGVVPTFDPAKPFAKPPQCMNVQSLTGTHYYDRDDTRINDRQIEYKAQDDWTVLPKFKSVSIVSEAYYGQRRSGILEIQARRDEVRKAEEKEKQKQTTKINAQYANNLKNAKKGTQISCNTGREVLDPTAPLSGMVFECSLVGMVSFGTLNANGWKTTHIERIPVTAFGGFRGVSVSIIAEKIK